MIGGRMKPDLPLLTKIVPYGDGTMDRCTQCNDDSFPMVDEGDPEMPKQGLVMVLFPEHREELLERLRRRYEERRRRRGR